MGFNWEGPHNNKITQQTNLYVCFNGHYIFASVYNQYKTVPYYKRLYEYLVRSMYFDPVRIRWWVGTPILKALYPMALTTINRLSLILNTTHTQQPSPLP